MKGERHCNESITSKTKVIDQEKKYSHLYNYGTFVVFLKHCFFFYHKKISQPFINKITNFHVKV